MLPRFSSRDLVAVLVKYLEDGMERRVVICSAYLPVDSEDPPPSKELEELVRYHEEEHLHLIIGCDSNAHHAAWSSTDCNGIREALVEFLDALGLEILNRGNKPTFCNGYRSEVIDGSFRLLDNIENWEVSMEPSLSDHRHIPFALRGSLPACLSRNPRGTNWGSFQEELRDSLSRGPMECTRDEAGLGLALQWLQHALITAYEHNCPMWLVKPVRNSLWQTVRLESLRRRVRRLFNKGCRDRTPRSWELYREAQRQYRREVQRASKQTWRAFCTSINELPRAARLHRALSKDPEVRLGSLVTPTRQRTQSEGETLNLLLRTHFPSSGGG
jgi:hypothetical protein